MIIKPNKEATVSYSWWAYADGLKQSRQRLIDNLKYQLGRPDIDRGFLEDTIQEAEKEIQ